MSIDEGISTLSSEYHVLSEPGASSHTTCDWGFDFNAFDAFYGEDALETLDIAMETGTEAAPLNPSVSVSSSALTLDTPTKRQSTHGLGTGEKTTQLRGPEPIDTGHSPVSVTRSVDFANDMATCDKALGLTRNAPTQMSSGIDPQRSAVFDWNLSGTDPAFPAFPNCDPDLGDSLELPPAGPIAFTTMRMQLPSQTSNGGGSAESSPPNLPDDICQLIAKECLKQHRYAGSNTLSPNLARDLAQNYLNKHGYHRQPPTTYSKISSSTTHQQTTQFSSSNLNRPTFSFPDPTQLASSPLPASFPQNFAMDDDFTASFFPGNCNIDIDIAQTPSRLGFEGSHFSHEDMAIPQTSFDGALFSATHNTNTMNNALYFDSTARRSTELPIPANSGQSPALTGFRTGAEPIEEQRGPLNQAQQDLPIASRPEASSTSSANSERQANLPALQKGNFPRSKRKNSSPHSGRSKEKSNETAIRRACLNCKLKNLKCAPHDLSTPCVTCRMAFGSDGKPEDLRLLKSICQDFDEKSLDIRKSILDFFNLGERNMPPFIPSGSTIELELELAHPLQIIALEAQCVTILMYALALKNGNKEILAKANCTLEELFILPQKEKTYRILEGTLPSHKQLIDWARFDIAIKAQLVPEDMECALDNFLDGYIQRGPHLPMNGFVNLVFEIASLAQFLDNGQPVLHNKSQEVLERIAKATDESNRGVAATSSSSPYMLVCDLNMSRIGEEIRNQFLCWIAKGFEERETQILFEFDKCMKNPAHPFILLTCVQRMMLLYRRIRERYYRFALMDRLDNMKTMTDLMVRRLCYMSSKAFRGNQTHSAFSDCFKKQQREALKEDDDLIARFDKLDLTERYLLKECERNPHDATYINLRQQMKDKRTARKRDKSAIPPGGPGSPLASPPFISGPGNEQEPKYRTWTLIQIFEPPPPPSTVDADTE